MQSNSNTDNSQTPTHVQGVNATAGGLVKATLGAALVAGAILLFAWLPAEHGVDPTGVGHLLGLTEMGHIKEHLHEEADADAKAALAEKTAAPAVVSAASSSSIQANAQINQKLDDIQLQLAALTKTVEATSQAVSVQDATAVESTDKPAESWLDEVEYVLEPGVGIEVKLKMLEGAVAEFEWSANGAVVNHDTHGDGNGKEISYEKGRSIPEQTGQLIAAFDGNHGWYWRNRTEEDVVVTLRTRGDYTGMVLP